MVTRNGHYLAVEILDDDGKPMCRIWEKIPERPRRDEGERTDYGRNWPALRDAIVARDGARCRGVGCSSTDDLQVHHIRPLRLFAGDVEAANDHANLITLCRPCHAAADVSIRAAERAS